MYLELVLITNSIKSLCTAGFCSFFVVLPQKGSKHTWRNQGTQDLGYLIKHDSSPIKNMIQFFFNNIAYKAYSGITEGVISMNTLCVLLLVCN